MPDLVRVNNTVFSWTSSRFLVDGSPMEGFVACDYEQKRERKIVHAARQQGTPLGWTSGKYSVPTCKIRILKENSQAFKQQLLLNPTALGSYGDAEFTMLIQAIEPTIGSLPITVAAAPCAVIGEREAREEGIDELVDEYDLAVLEMSTNGLVLWSLQRLVSL